MLGRIAVIALACLAVLTLLITFALNSAYSGMSPHEQKLVTALKQDLLTGRWNLKRTKETAQQNLQESQEKLKQSAKRVDAADRAYEQALAEQKRIVAAAKKRKTGQSGQPIKGGAGTAGRAGVAEKVKGPSQTAERE